MKTQPDEFKVGDKFEVDGFPMRIDLVLGDDKYRLYAPFGYRGLFKEKTGAELRKTKEAKS